MDREVTKELLLIAFPVLATLAADPLAGLVGTAFVGRIGAVELAAVGVALSIFNSVTKLFNVPLLSITTSSVAMAKGQQLQLQAQPPLASLLEVNLQEVKYQGLESEESEPLLLDPHDSIEQVDCTTEVSTPEQLSAPESSTTVGAAASSALLLALIVGLFEALLLLVAGPLAGRLWGLHAHSQMRTIALQFLRIRALGAPVTLMMLVLQGVFRGLQDTRTPLAATLAANVINIALTPLFIFHLGMGAKGAALATVVGEAVPCVVLVYQLSRRYPLRLSDAATVAEAVKQFAPTGHLMARSVAVMSTYAVASSLAARAGVIHAAAHQICFQLWLASSLLADSLAVAAQTLLARSMASGELLYGQTVVSCAVTMAGGMGLVLVALLASLHSVLPPLFTKDHAVLWAVAGLLPIVIMTQPINAFAFVWDGVLFGAGGFRYAGVAMAFCAGPAVAIMLAGSYLSTPGQRLGAVWAGLAALMLLRSVSIAVPYRMRTTPFKLLFLQPAAIVRPDHASDEEL